MNILFVNSNLYGHINPTLPLVRNLTEKGHQVSYYCSREFESAVTEAGALWIPLGERVRRFLSEYHPTDRHPFFMLMEYILSYDEVILPELLRLTEEHTYDMVICDSIFGASTFLRFLIPIPVVCSHSSFAMEHAPVPPRMLVPGFHPQLDHCYEILSRICEKYSLPVPTLEEVFVSKGERNIVYTAKSFNGEDSLSESEYFFVGPNLCRKEKADQFDQMKTLGRKIVYISLGSLNTDFRSFYQTCIEAFRGKKDYFVFLSIGQKISMNELTDIPENFDIKSFQPQYSILKSADVFLTHAGFNSVNEALVFGVPMLAFPQVNDQRKVAKQMVKMGAGYESSMEDLTPVGLFHEVEKLLSDSSVKEKCALLSEQMKKANRCSDVVDLLSDFLKTRQRIK